MRFLLVLAGLLVACTAETATPPVPPPPAARADLPPPGERTYGIYLNGHKVGWMLQNTVVGDTVELSMELNAQVGGLGTVSKIRLAEKRSYKVADGSLATVSFEQQAATGSVKVSGTATAPGKLDLVITAGGGTSTQKVEVKDQLTNEMALIELARRAEIGDARRISRFDASVQKQIDIHHEVVAVEDRLLAGVAARAVQVRSSYPALGITETAWLDPQGTVLESRIGGFFVARLEPPDVAKRLDYSQDLLISAVVATPAPIAEPEKLGRLEVTFVGFDADNLPPASDRQLVKARGDRVTLTLSLDPPPQASLPLPVSADDAEMLAATPFIQSDAQALRDAARRVTAGSTDLFEVVRRLTAFVYEHVRDEYVPAYSNALEAYESRRGDCTEHAVLFVALARALGIPARVAVGIAYWPQGSGFGWHAWAEVKSGGRWTAVDPTWNQPIADATHVKLADGGPAEQARIVMLLGKLKVVRLQST